MLVESLWPTTGYLANVHRAQGVNFACDRFPMC